MLTLKILSSPGHVFPLRARKGGVLVRTPDRLKALLDLSRLAGLDSSGIICEIMREDGTMARLPDLEEFAVEYGLKIRYDCRPHPLPSLSMTP